MASPRPVIDELGYLNILAGSFGSTFLWHRAGELASTKTSLRFFLSQGGTGIAGASRTYPERQAGRMPGN